MKTTNKQRFLLSLSLVSTSSRCRKLIGDYLFHFYQPNTGRKRSSISGTRIVKKKINKRKNQCKWLMLVLILNVFFFGLSIYGTTLAFKLLRPVLDHWWSLKSDWLIHAIFISIAYSAVNHPVHFCFQKSKMYKLSNLYKRAQCGKGKGKAGPQRVGGGGGGGRYSQSV